MNFYTHTKICIIGNNFTLDNFEKKLPIKGDFLDFDEIIKQPIEIVDLLQSSNDSEKDQIYDWRTQNWGTPTNGELIEIKKEFLTNYRKLEISISTAFNEPTKIINHLASNNLDLNFLVFHHSYTEDAYISAKMATDDSFKLLCEVTGFEDTNHSTYTIYSEFSDLLSNQDASVYLFLREFLSDSTLGRHVLEKFDNKFKK